MKIRKYTVILAILLALTTGLAYARTAIQIDDFGAITGPTAFARFTTLAQVQAFVGAVNNTTVIVNNTLTAVTQNVSLNIKLEFTHTGGLSVNVGQTVTFLGSATQVNASTSQQIFAGAGNVAFTLASILHVGWFGDNTSSIPIQAAVNSLPAVGGRIVFTTAQHTITVTTIVRLAGVRVGSSNITFTSPVRTEFVPFAGNIIGAWFLVGVNVTTDIFAQVSNVYFENLVFSGSATVASGVPGQTAIEYMQPVGNYTPSVDGSFDIGVRDSSFDQLSYGIIMIGVYRFSVLDSLFTNMIYNIAATGQGYGVYYATSDTGLIHNNRMIAGTMDNHAVYGAASTIPNVGNRQNINITVTNNYVDWSNIALVAPGNNFRSGFTFRNHDGLIVMHNTILSPIEDGINLNLEFGNGSDTIIAYNMILDIRNGEAAIGAGIYLRRVAVYTFTNLTIINNTITSAENTVCGLIFENVDGLIVGNNQISVAGAASYALRLGGTIGDEVANAIILPNIMNGGGTAAGFLFESGTHTNTKVYAQNARNLAGATYTRAGVPVWTGLSFMFKIGINVDADGAGGIVVTDDPDGMVNAVVSDADGARVQLIFDVDLTNAWISIINNDGTDNPEDNVYYLEVDGNPTNGFFTVGILTAAGAFKPIATNSNEFNIVLHSPH